MKKIYMMLASVLAFAMHAVGAEPVVESAYLLDGAAKQNAIDSICASYHDWTSAAWTARLKADVLPVTVTLRATMERGKTTRISMRAPLVGEVARIEASADSILILNKMKRKYAVVDRKKMIDINPLLATDPQPLLLGRILILGAGELDAYDADSVQVYNVPDAGWLVVPAENMGLPETVYGYSVNTDGTIQTLIVNRDQIDASVASSKQSSLYESMLSAEVVANHRSKKKVLLDYISPTISLNGELEVEPIEWGAPMMDPVVLNKKYTKTTLKECLKF